MKFSSFNRFHRVLLTAALVGLAMTAQAQLPQVTKQASETELVITADFTGNGLADVVIINRASGAFRLGRQTAAGVLKWGEPVASGVANVSDVSAGRLLSAARHALLVTSPLSNRIHVLDLAVTHPAPLPLYVPGRTGPAALVTGQFVGTGIAEDVVVATEYNSAPNLYALTHGVYNGSNFLSAAAPGFHLDSSNPFSRAQRVAISNLAQHAAAVGYLLQSGPSTACLRVVSLGEAGLPLILNACGLPGDARYHLVRFGGSAVGGILSYSPGDTSFQYRSLNFSGSTFTVAALQTFSLPQAVRAIVPVLAGPTVRLAILSADGYELTVHNFDGSSLSAPLQTIFAADPGQPLLAVLPSANGDGMITLAGGSGGDSSKATFHQWTGGGFVESSSSSFAPLGVRAGSANVSLMSGEPFVDPAARPVLLRNTRDWTSGTPPLLPGTVQVTAEAFHSEAVGLTDPQLVSLGGSPAGANYALLNQYAGNISVFTLTRASGAQVGNVGISPAPGLYDRSIQLSFDSLPGGMEIHFRDSDGVWQIYTDIGAEPDNSDPSYLLWFAQFRDLVRYKDTVIEYFGINGAGERTPIRRAEFRFTEGPDTLSTLGDGVPDYAKLGLGINPFRLPDGDATAGIGNSLQAILDGSGIPPRWLSGAAVDVYVRPLAHDGTGNGAVASLLATDPLPVLPDGTEYGGNQIFAHTLSGALVGQGRDPLPATPERNEGLGLYPPFAEASAYLSNLSGEESGLFVVSTRSSFALTGTLPTPPLPSSVGREMVSLLALDGLSMPVYTRPYGATGLISEGLAWRNGAIAFHAAQPPPVVVQTVDAYETIAALVFERWLQGQLLERALLPANFALTIPDAITPPTRNPDFLTITGYRSREGANSMASAASGAVSPTTEAIRAVANWSPSQPAYRISGVANAIRDLVRNSIDPGFVALRAVADDVYRISAAHGNAFPGVLDPPIDVLRQFVATGGLPEPYTAVFSSLGGAPFTTLATSVYANAVDAIAAALSAPAPRPTQTMTVEIRADSFDFPSCLLVQEAFAPGNLLSLFNRDGRAFRLPASFSLLPGARFAVTAFTDAPFPSCAGASSLEVIEWSGSVLAEVVLLPTASGNDDDGNLLGDDWELAFFGTTGVDPWTDPNGDGYTYLQKYLDGKDPFLPASFMSNPPAYLALPVLRIASSAPGTVVIDWEFSDAYAPLLNFQFYADPSLSGAWVPIAATIIQTAPNAYQTTLSSATLRLRRGRSLAQWLGRRWQTLAPGQIAG